VYNNRVTGGDTLKTTLKKLTELGRRIASLHISVYSGNAAFFLLLSLFPAEMALMVALRYLPATAGDFEVFLTELVPSPIHGVVRWLVTQLSAGSPAVLSASAFGAMWAVTRGMLSITNGLDAVYHSHHRRPLLRKWAVSLFGAILMMVCILATLLLQVFGKSLYQTAIAHNFVLAGMIGAVLQLRWPLTIGFLTLVFCLLYTLLPCRRLRFVQNVPGALLATVGWHLYSALYGFYVENFSSYANLYGGLTAVVITLLWVYFCMNLIFYGGLMNYILAEQAHPLKRLWAYLRN
jgi:membrane protein